MQYPITQLFRVDAALVLEKMKHHQTYRFHPRPDASEGGPALMSVLVYPFTCHSSLSFTCHLLYKGGENAILIETWKFCRELIYFVGAVRSGNGRLQITEHYCLLGKKKWCSCIGRNGKLAVSYAFGNSLEVHSGVLTASKMVKVNGCCGVWHPGDLNILL